jgi:hypothetical protein
MLVNEQQWYLAASPPSSLTLTRRRAIVKTSECYGVIPVNPTSPKSPFLTPNPSRSQTLPTHQLPTASASGATKPTHRTAPHRTAPHRRITHTPQSAQRQARTKTPPPSSPSPPPPPPQPQPQPGPARPPPRGPQPRPRSRTRYAQTPGSPTHRHRRRARARARAPSSRRSAPPPREPVVQRRQRPRVPRHDFEDDGGPVAAAVPDLARLDGAGAAGAGTEVGSATAAGAAAATALRGPGGAQGLVPDVGVSADVELRAHDCDFGGDFAGGGGGGGEGDAHGVEERVGEREEEVRRDAGGELGVVEALDAGRGRDGRERERRRERAEGEPRDVVEGEQLDLVARRGDFGFGLREDVPAGAAPLAAFCTEESGDGAQFVLEFGGWGELVRLLGGGERVVPAFGFERFDGRGVGGGLMWN